MLKIFISHSSYDTELAKALTHLLKDALGLSASSIRCTSVDGYRLAGGANTDEQLRLEIADAEAFIGLLSKTSLSSTYVTFELGARWGVKKHLVPLLAPGIHPSSLEGPMAALNALSCDNSSQMHQLVSDLAIQLDLSVCSSASYQCWIDQIIGMKIPDPSEVISESLGRPTPSVASFENKPSDDSVVGVRERIKQVAAIEHPGDFSTQQYVVQEQLSNWGKLRDFLDAEVPSDIQSAILRRSEMEHPGDYSTQLYVVEEQIENWKKLNE